MCDASNFSATLRPSRRSSARYTTRPCRRDRGAPRSGNSPAGFRSWEEARVRPTLPDRAMRAYARLLRAPIARNSAGQPAAPARISRPRTASGPGSLVGDELEQASVGIAEVHAQTSSLRSGPLDRAELDPYSTGFEMRDRVRDRPVVGEAQIAVARLDRHPRDRPRVKSRAVYVELLVAEAVGPALARPNQLRAEHVSVERIRHGPVRHMDDAVIEPRRQPPSSIVRVRTHGSSSRPALLGHRDRGRAPVLEQRREQDHDPAVAVVGAEVHDVRPLDHPFPGLDAAGAAARDPPHDARLLIRSAAVDVHDAALDRVRQRALLDVCELNAGMAMQA